MMGMIRGLEVWRDLDHSDAIKLSRHEVIELLNEIEDLRVHLKQHLGANKHDPAAL